MSIRKRNKLVHGVGINDSNYKTHYKVNGKGFRCNFYSRWVDMLTRCYSKKFQEIRPTYVGCSVCDEWLTFSAFKRWMEMQDWKGKELDKDIICKGNKVYSPETCAFVDPMTNKFTNNRESLRGEWMIGASIHNISNKFQAECKNPFTKKNENLGLFLLEGDAHLAWKKRKHELACQLADLQTDPRVAEALRTRYL